MKRVLYLRPGDHVEVRIVEGKTPRKVMDWIASPHHFKLCITVPEPAKLSDIKIVE